MGTTPTPLNFIVPISKLNHPWVKAMEAKGHHFNSSLDEVFQETDLILLPNAHACPDVMWDKPTLLDVAVKKARAAKRLTTPTKSGKVRGKMPHKESA